MSSPMRYPVASAAEPEVTVFTPETSVFGGVGMPPVSRPSSGPDYVAIAASPEFNRLRQTLLKFVFPMTGLFLGWYLLYVLLAAYAHSFMSFRLWGDINVGLILGLLQFVSTAVITVRYARFAKRRVDPQVAAIRAQAGVVES